jgi:lactoylglutathione lyase
MDIEHIAIWTPDLEKLKNFYMRYFGAKYKSKYVNVEKQFESYFLSFSEGVRLELMQIPGIEEIPEIQEEIYPGYAHFAISVGSKEKVDQLSTQIENNGFKVVSRPRYTGDGYYESVVLDPDGNQIEIAI